jgi:hypothetical protein
MADSEAQRGGDLSSLRRSNSDSGSESEPDARRMRSEALLGMASAARLDFLPPADVYPAPFPGAVQRTQLLRCATC